MIPLPSNVGLWDRAVHIGIGGGLLAATFFGPQVYLGWIGVGPLLAGLVGYDPLYDLFGFSTNRLKAAR